MGTIAANSGQVIGDLIVEAMENVGKDGVITAEEVKAVESSMEVLIIELPERKDKAPATRPSGGYNKDADTIKILS